MQQNKTLSTFFIFLAVLLMVLPPLLTFNELLTRVIDRFALYQLLQNLVIPIQAQLVGLLAKPFGISYTAYADGMLVNGNPMQISWNCLGWQSLLLFILSSFITLRGNSYTRISSLKALILGFLGLFWINLFRMAFIVYLAVFAQPIYAYIYHNVLAAVVTIMFLLCFWWFAYGFLLEIRKPQ